MTSPNSEHTPMSAIDRHQRIIDVNNYQDSQNPRVIQSRYGGSALEAIRFDIEPPQPRRTQLDRETTEVLSPNELQWLSQLTTKPDQELTGEHND